MERVSDERLTELISSDEAWRDNSGELDEDERRWYEDRIAALTELREMRKVRCEVSKMLRNKEWAIDIEGSRVALTDYQGLLDARDIGDGDWFSALAALVERGEGKK